MPPSILLKPALERLTIRRIYSRDPEGFVNTLGHLRRSSVPQPEGVPQPESVPQPEWD